MATAEYYLMKAEQHKTAAALARQGNQLELEKKHLAQAKQYQDLAEGAKG